MTRDSSMVSFRHRIVIVLLLATSVVAGACVNVFWKTDARALARPRAGADVTFVQSPLKVHMADGSTVVFRSGAAVSHDRIAGAGQSFPLLSDRGTPRETVPMDSVIGVETFEGKVLTAPTLFASVAATAAAGFGAALLAVAIFGSCPTVYADTGAGLVLEAEGFSYAIAPLMEHRDVDRLRARPDSAGTLRLELRNEALETHYINNVELLHVRHPSATRVVPDQSGRPVALGALMPVSRAVDRAGRDVRATLAEQEGTLYATAPSVVQRAREGDLDDWIDVEASSLPPGDSIAVLLRLRNSLLNTVLLYEGILGGRDAADWMNSGLQRISTAVDMARWYSRTMGLRATVDGVRLPDHDLPVHARLGDVGPIAFRDVALVLPRPSASAGHARVRLRFVADNWRIDQVLVAGTVARPAMTTVPVTRVVVPTPATGVGPVLDGAAVRAVAEVDDGYLETRPGQRMTLVFDGAGRMPAGDTTSTYLIAWQGWYREWIRGSWLAAPTRTTPFVPGDAAVLTALRRWTERKPSFERQFYSTRIPVR